MIDGDRDFVERRTGAGDFVAVLVVVGTIAAVAFGWWSVGTTPLVEKPRTTIPEGGTSVTL
jgi:hypothetical protein